MERSALSKFQLSVSRHTEGQIFGERIRKQRPSLLTMISVGHEFSNKKQL
jgi:hypothetical protein